jgi:hypothetical protein
MLMIYWKMPLKESFFRWGGRCPFDAVELAMHKGCCDVVLNFSVK